MGMDNGNLQILGYSLETPDDLEEIEDLAWKLFCDGEGTPRRDD